MDGKGALLRGELEVELRDVERKLRFAVTTSSASLYGCTPAYRAMPGSREQGRIGAPES